MNRRFPHAHVSIRATVHTLLVLVAALWGLPSTTQAQEQDAAVVGSKKFTESVILAEMVTQLLESRGLSARHRQELGGTRFLWNGLRTGDIDAYPEYTGTITQEILAGAGLQGAAAIRDTLPHFGLRMTEPLGFNNTYALGMKKEQAEALGIRTISDLRAHPGLRFGFTNEFMDRGDGWPSLRRHYDLPQRNVRGIDHDLAYRGLESGTIDVIDLYSTDAEIEQYDLQVLEDDRRHFSEYKAVLLYRADLPEEAVRVLEQFAGILSTDAMTRLNARVKIDGVPEARVASDFLQETFDLADAPEIEQETWLDRLWLRTKEHLILVAVSLGAAILVAIPLGVVAAQFAAVGQVILGIVGIIYTIPSLALLVFMIPLLGIGGPPAIAALFLYSLLPIVRNTHAGLQDIPGPMRESAEALGLTPVARLRLVDLPMATRSILAGIKTSAIINAGTATLGALIGAGGYGQPILTGIRLDDMNLILEGAIPAAVLALLLQGLFEAGERFMLPKGLRLAT